MPTIPKPSDWSNDAITGSLVSLFKLKKIVKGSEDYNKALERLAGKEVTPMPWDGFKIWAEAFSISNAKQVLKGPERISAMMRDESLKKLITEYLQDKKVKRPAQDTEQIRIFANDAEQSNMEKCHAVSIKEIRKFMSELPSMKKESVLEVAAGDGRLSKDLLKGIFQRIDCFDQCPQAVAQLEMLRQSIIQINFVDQYTMQTYFWQA